MPKKSNNNIPRFYWDSNVFVSLLDDEEECYSERAPIIATLLEEAENGRIEIYTSVFSMTEVAYLSVDKVKLTDESLDKINSLWNPLSSPIKLVDVHQFITIKARDVLRKTLKNKEIPTLKPADAIHIATALDIGAHELHSYDQKMKRSAEILDLSVCEPYTDKFLFDEHMFKRKTSSSKKRILGYYSLPFMYMDNIKDDIQKMCKISYE